MDIYFDLIAKDDEDYLTDKDLKGKLLPVNNIFNAEREVLDKDLIPAIMPLLIRNFPHSNWCTTDSGDISGIDKSHKYCNEDHDVITLHGGMIKLLPPEKLQLAMEMHKRKTGGVSDVRSFVLTDLFDEDPLKVLLNDCRLLDNTYVDVVAYDQFLEEKIIRGYTSPFAVVRPLSLARETISGNESVERLLDHSGEVRDSQVIVYTGGKKEAQRFIDKTVHIKWSTLGVWHPFNLAAFNPEKSQARFLYLGSISKFGLNGLSDISYEASFVGYHAEIPDISIAVN